MTKATRIPFVPLLLILALVLLITMSIGTMAADAQATEVTNVTFYTEPCASAPGGKFQTVLYVEEGSALIDFQIALSFSDTLIAHIEATPLVSNLMIDIVDNVAYITFTNVEDNLTDRTELICFSLTLRDNISVSDVDTQTGLSDAYPFLSFEETYHETSAEANTMDDDLSFRPLTISSAFGGVSVYTYGDVNRSGHVSINDVTVLRQYLVGMRELTDDQSVIANVYVEQEGDGESADERGLSIFDAALIQKSLTSDISLDPRPNESENGESSTTPDNAEPDDGDLPNDVACTHEVSEQTQTVSVAGCHDYTITKEACSCGEVCRILHFEAPTCNFQHDKSLDDETSMDAFYGTKTVSVCSDEDCSLVLCVSELSGVDSSQDDQFVHFTLTEYCILHEDGTYEVICSFSSEYQVED